MLAHVAEVDNLTGLGDVCGQFHGGCLLKLEAGQPLAARRVALPEGQEVYVKVLGSLSTAAVLGNSEARALIKEAGERAMVGLTHFATIASVSFRDLIRISRQFAEESGLLALTSVKSLVEQIEANGGHASMIMLGNAVFSDTYFPGSQALQVATDCARACGLVVKGT
jgi:pantoate kinase